MTKLVVIAEVDDQARWEQGFKSHKDLFRELRDQSGIHSPVFFGKSSGDRVVVIEDVDDGATALEAFNSERNRKAMAEDGVRVDTAQAFLVDQEMAF
ncbi:hypothetical protein [Altererythrobacter sp.]|uniref:hypothetical protein n=1 Tax=Altererythrobacter sp. TaxID=1872480 RepID=UPI003D0F2560